MNDISGNGIRGIVDDETKKIGKTLDIDNELDIVRLRPGTQFYARFVHDPNGDTLRWAQDNIRELRTGKVTRHGISAAFWEGEEWKTRPPLAQYLGKGKFKMID